jgi:hypothetical protein
MHHRVTLIVLARQARKIEPAVGAAASEPAGRVVLSCFHSCELE